MKKDSPSMRERISGLSPEKARLLDLLLHKGQRPAGEIEACSRDYAAGPVRLPTSDSQRRLWFIDQLEGDCGAYHIPAVVRLYGDLDRASLQTALNALVNRHESLRTRFVNVDGQPKQEIAQSGSIVLDFCDLSSRAPRDREVEMARQSHEQLSMPIDLRAGPLLRGKLLCMSRREHVMLMAMHHIIADAWSITVLVRELAELYAAARGGREASLSSLPVQYADYARWQTELSVGVQHQAQLSYWLGHLRGAPHLLELPLDRPRPPRQSYRGANVTVQLDAALVIELRRVSQQLNLTLAMTLQAAWCVLLSRLSGQLDLVIGMPVTNRPRTELESLIGFFVNTLAVRVQLDDDPTVAELLPRVREIMLGAYANQSVPFEKVVEALHPARSLSHSPVFQVMFALHGMPPAAVSGDEVTFKEEEAPVHTAQFDLSLSLHEAADGLRGRLNYATDLFDDSTIRRWERCYIEILREMLRQPQQRVSRVPLLIEGERRQLLEAFNATGAEYPEHSLIHRLFEAQAQRTPEAVALAFEGSSLTYANLNSRANQLARYLRERGVRPDELVAICAERSLEMVIGLLGTLKAGGAYVPLDPDYPAERLSYMLADAAPRLLLTQQRLLGRLPPTSATLIALDGDWNSIAQQSDTDLDAEELGLNSGHLAYMIYTSGSTGRPKGAMNEHRAVINRLHWMQQAYRLDPTDRVLQKTPFSFDVSVWEFFWPLIVGARLVLAQPRGHQDPRYVRAIIEEAGITTLHFVPSMLQVFVDQLHAGECPNVQHVVCSGEELPASLQRRFFERLPHARLSNLYGPTEAAVDVTFWECAPSDTGSRVPIGRPISNARIYILDPHREIVPIGVAGEIYIGGVAVGRGYLNRPELTAERFVRDPFSSDPQARLYRTGDLGRWRADGAVEYLGRNDYQVKIRGFRIELGEIEAQLTRHERVKEAAVVVREEAPGDKRLTAYVVVTDAASAPSADELRAHLKASLPEYMVPGAFVKMARLPLTPNGKLDRRALPAPELTAFASREYEAPQGEVEQMLAGIWQGLLGVERIGRQDNFFELGGHSLLIMQMLERMRGVRLSAEVRVVFENPTLQELAAIVAGKSFDALAVPPNLIPAGCQSITPEMLPLVEVDPQHIERIAQSAPGGAANIQDIYPLTPIQEGILFHHLFEERGGDTYVLPTVLAIPTRSRVDELIAALQAVIDAHDVLRTAMLWEQLPRPLQIVYRQATLPVEEASVEPGGESQLIEDWLKPERQRLDIRSAPLLRLRIAAVQNGWYVLLQLHHITIDHLALEIIMTEIVAHLEGRCQIAPESMPYRNHVAQSLAYARAHDADVFFRNKLGDVSEPTAPFGLLNVHGDGTQIDEAREAVEPALALRIRAAAAACGVSAATLFHAAWGMVVAHTSARDDVVFGSVLLGRLHGSAGTQQALGMFINTLPLRLRLEGLTSRQLVEQTQRELIDLLSHEQASLTDAQRCSRIVGSVPLFSSILNYRHSAPNARANWSTASGVQVLAVQERTNYPVTLSIDDLGDGYRLVAQTDENVDPRRLVGYLRTAMTSLVHALEHAPDTVALTLPILPDDERRSVIELFNRTSTEYRRDRLIHQLFEEQARRTPNATAAVHGSRSVTYAELDARADRLARHITAHGVGRHRLVAICAERSIEMLVGVLGILKAGAAYVPLDPNYPSERLEHMLRDSAPCVLLTQRSLQSVLPVTSALVVMLDEASWQTSHTEAGLSPVEPDQHADDLLYVIYTSGSTGKPKGIAMPHRAMANLIEWHREQLPLRAGQRVLQFAALSFDVAFQEIFSTLCLGGALVLPDEDVRRDARALLELLSVQSVERLFVPPLMLQSLAEHFTTVSVNLRRLRDVITAGEQLRISPEIVEFFRKVGACRLHNHYGPTETHVVTTLTLTGRADEWPTLPAIGRPISNTQIYILDARSQPTPMGVAGEIHIGGANLASGYLNQPELTAQRFLPDPFGDDASARMYRTGDLGRWKADGSIEYLGRNDDQVKIRGYRIELGEIENQLARISHVTQAAVSARVDAQGRKRLVGYVVFEGDGRTSVADLRTQLKSLLPDYMIPSAFVVLDRLPQTPTGKLDRRALPAPDLQAYASSRYEAPQGRTELALAEVWQAVLGVDRVGRQDNFFELGGHSLLALRALFKINEALGCNLRVSDAYRNPTIRELAGRIDGGANSEAWVDIFREAVLADEIVPQARALPRHNPARAVLLTGATGFVGRFLLVQLLRDTGAKIYCLVRATSRDQAITRLRSSLLKWDLWCEEFESRIAPIAGDLSLPRLGIEESVYQQLCETIDTVYHCATSMNHLETYAMAKAVNVDATKDLVKFATHRKAKLINYISTLGAFNSLPGDAPRVVDETTPIEHEKHSVAVGYTASKWVSEKILMLAEERGVACNIFRLGLVWADTQRGRFDELQNIYRVMKTCLLSGCGIQDYHYPMAPTPVDYVARAVVFLSGRHADGGGIFHVSSSNQNIDDVFRRCGEITGAPLHLVSHYDWICEIKRLHLEGRSLPAVPLIEFAFSMDEESFRRHNLAFRSAVNVRFDLSRTHRALERAGIVAPALDEDLLAACLEDMLARDPDLEELSHALERVRCARDVNINAEARSWGSIAGARRS